MLRNIASGETVIITRRGEPVAKLIPAGRAGDIADVIVRMKATRQSRASMSRSEVLAARDEGRR